MIRRIRGALIALLLATATLGTGGCGDGAEDRMRAAKPTAEKYLEYVMAGDYEGAYRNTLAKSYRAQMDVDTFVQYRKMFAGRTGQLRGYTLVDSTDNTHIRRVRLIFALEGDGHVNEPPQEVIDLEQEDGEWKIAGLDMKLAKPEKPKSGPSEIPLPLGNRPAQQPPAR